MQNGVTAGWLTAGTMILAALIGGYFSRAGSVLNRRTETEKMLYDRLKVEEARSEAVEKHCEELQTELQALRKENIAGMMAQERLAELQAKLKEVPAIRQYPEILRVVQDVDKTGET